MTGFGSAEKNSFRVDVRSLNHRYIEIFVKMPFIVSEHEMTLRNMIKERFRRGRFDVNISFTDKPKTSFKANIKAASELYNAFDYLRKELSIEGAIDLKSMLIFKDIILGEDIEYNPDDLFDAFKAAIANLYKMRLKEGKTLRESILDILRNLTLMHEQMGISFQNSLNAHRDNLKKKISNLLLTMPIDEARLSQEIALIAQRTDITEELERIKSHLKQFAFIISNNDEVGKKLDFILQEILREANTIASKTDILEIINLSIDIKTDVEKLRELVQNIQ